MKNEANLLEPNFRNRTLKPLADKAVVVGIFLAKVATLVSLWIADALLWVMLVTRSNERTS